MPLDDSWDWPILLYIATVMLGRSERQFWRMTPRKLNALTRAHVKMNPNGDGEADKPQKQAFIDQII